MATSASGGGIGGGASSLLDVRDRAMLEGLTGKTRQIVQRDLEVILTQPLGNLDVILMQS